MIELHGETFLVRRAEDTDRPLIYATWMRSYKLQRRDVDSDVYDTGQAAVIDRLVGDARVLCRSHAADTIHAWVCGHPGVLHYVYVRPDLRGMGFAKSLVSFVCGERPELTHRWPLPTRPDGWTFNPYRLGMAA